ncbi:MAG: ATP-binding protein [Casimicrobiaceae bacterium]
MQTWLRKPVFWQVAWAAIVLLGALVLVRYDIAIRRDAFQNDARIAHSLLSQRAVQHDAILATLALLSPGLRPEQRLPAVYPQILTVLRREESETWPQPNLVEPEILSREMRRAVVGDVDPQKGQYTLVLAAIPSSFALRVDALRMAASDESSLTRTSAIRATLAYADRIITLQPGDPVAAQPSGLTSGFVFEKTLSAPSQPFLLRLSRATGPAEWPWTGLLSWAVIAGFVMAAMASWLRGRREQRRAEELLRVGRVERLNTLGELAGGIAHELNQPLAAILANTQAAQRMLDDDPPELTLARQAMTQAATQGRRAADVVGRFRRLIEAPGAAQPQQAVQLDAVVRKVLYLLEPELRRRGINGVVHDRAPLVLADPVALEQIVHNLVDNAMHALETVPSDERRLELDMRAEESRAVLTIRDSGPGIAPDALPHLFEPFCTTRPNGLGLGLSLCESLAHAMEGTLTAHHATPRGAEFRLTLPLAKVQS